MFGRVTESHGQCVVLAGLAQDARWATGSRWNRARAAHRRRGVRLEGDRVHVFPNGDRAGLALGDRAELLGPRHLAPDDGWIGRVIDPFGQPLDGRPLAHGRIAPRPVTAAPPPPARRGRLGKRLDTGMAVFNTLLPLVAGSGWGCSPALAWARPCCWAISPSWCRPMSWSSG